MLSKQAEKQNSIDEEVVMESTESQIIETGFVAKEAADSELNIDVHAKNKITHSKKHSVDMLLIKMLIAVFIVAILGFLGYQELDSINKKHQNLQEQLAAESAQKIVSVISQRVSLFQQKFSNFQLTQMKDGEVISSEELFSGSRVLYFSLPLNHNAIVDNPTQGYVFLDLLNQLYKHKKATVSSLEFIKPNSEHSSIVLAKKILDKDKKTVGLSVLKIPRQFAIQLVEKIDLLNGSILLVQGETSAIQLSSAGPHINNAIKNTQAVGNTHWKIIYSLNLKTSSIVLSSYYLLTIYAVLSLACLIFMVFLAGKYVIKLREKKRKQKELLGMESENFGHSALKNKESISQLGMNKSEVLIDKTVKSKEQFNAAATAKQSAGKLDATVITDYGIRGIFGEKINASVFAHLAHGIAQEMENNDLSQLCIGYDGRASSQELHQALLEGLKPYNIKIIDLGLATLPVVYYVALTQTSGNALMLTAGSSTAEYNGLKLLLNNEIVTEPLLNSFIDIEQEKGPQQYQLEKQDCNHLYINQVTEKFNLQKKLKVVVDFANGVSSQIVLDLLKMLGCNVVPIFEELDGNFPSHAPNPSRPENLQQLTEKVKSESADIGLAFNSDGSAIGVVASNGDIIWNDRVLMLLARDLLEQNPGAKVMFDVKSTSALHDWIIQFKGEPELTPSGYSAIKQRMDANNALLGGEFSGHFFFAEHANGLDDAFYTAAKILQILSAYDGSSETLFKELPEKISTPEILIAVQPGQQSEILEKIRSQKAEFMPAGIITLDGLRVEYEDGWGMVRQSRTTSSLSLRFEADTPQALQRIAEKFKEVILSVVFVKFPY